MHTYYLKMSLTNTCKLCLRINIEFYLNFFFCVHIGSSRSLEPDLVVDPNGQAAQKGVQIEGLVADDDTTAMY